MEWKKYIDNELTPNVKNLTTRDKAVTICSKCQYRSVVLVNNLKKQIKTKGTHLCRTCSSREGTLKARRQYEKTMFNLYGARNPNQVPEIKEKIKKTSQERYGEEGSIGVARKAFKTKYQTDNPFRMESVKKKIIESTKNKYGVEHINQLPERRNNLSKKMLKKYGHGSPLRAKLLKRNKCKNYEELCVKIVKKIEETGLFANHPDIEKHFGTDGSTLIKALIHIDRQDLIRTDRKFSQPEKDIVELISKHYDGPIIENNRTILNGKELDIYLPELNIAIEFNGLIWHSERFLDDKNRHHWKYIECQKQGITLYTIWEHEWSLARESLEQFLIKLVTPKKRIYARKCNVIEDPNLLEAFIQKHHLQGSAPSHTYLGLEYEGEIVMAISIGNHHRKGSECSVLNRVCFSDYNVVGGLERLLKRISVDLITWSDNRYSPIGNMYRNSGFELEEELKPDYFYCDSNGNAYSKQSKKKSVTGCPKDKKEWEWCWENGLYRVWDCGKKRWVRRKNPTDPKN